MFANTTKPSSTCHTNHEYINQQQKKKGEKNGGRAHCRSSEIPMVKWLITVKHWQKLWAFNHRRWLWNAEKPIVQIRFHSTDVYYYKSYSCHLFIPIWHIFGLSCPNTKRGKKGNNKQTSFGWWNFRVDGWWRWLAYTFYDNY